MLQLAIPDAEFYDEAKGEFVYVKATTLLLEHSLISISKWEAKWEKPFLSKDSKTTDEIIDYVRCMLVNSTPDPNIFLCLDSEKLTTVMNYINAKMSATWFRNEDKPIGHREVVTSELIYYWMVAYNIPAEYQKWHLNRLLTLIRICSEKNKPQKKRSAKEIMSRNARLNAERRAKYHTSG